MNIRYARATDKNQIVSLWNYCFEDGEDFVKYYFENVYDKKNTIIIEENNEVLSALQLNKYKIDLRNRKYDVSYVVGVSSKPEVRGLGYMKWRLIIDCIKDMDLTIAMTKFNII